MKLLTALFASAVVLTACNQAPSQTAASPAVSPVSPAATPATPATATGTVDSVDLVNGKISIAHDPVPALNWPAMTMAFAATPEQLQSVKAGQQVDFEFVAQGTNASLTSIRSR